MNRMRTRAQRDQIGLSVAEQIHHAGAATGLLWLARARRRFRIAAGRLADESHRNHRPNLRLRHMDGLRHGVAAHLPVGNRHGRAKLFAGDVLETLKSLLGIVQRSRFLVSTRQSEFRRCVQRIQLQRRLVLQNGVLVILALLIAAAQQIMCVRIVRIERNRVLEILNRFRGVAVFARNQSQVVPRRRVVRVLCDDLAQHRARLRQLLRIEQRNSLIQLRRQQGWIFLDGGRKQFLRLIEILLVHVRHAEIVQLNGVCLRSRAGLAPSEGGDEKKNGENLRDMDARKHGNTTDLN